MFVLSSWLCVYRNGILNHCYEKPYITWHSEIGKKKNWVIFCASNHACNHARPLRSLLCICKRLMCRQSVRPAKFNYEVCKILKAQIFKDFLQKELLSKEHLSCYKPFTVFKAVLRYPKSFLSPFFWVIGSNFQP